MQQARVRRHTQLRAHKLHRSVTAARAAHPMRPATRLTWLRGLSQSALVALAVMLTHWGDQVFTPHTEFDRILVLLSLRLPITGLKRDAGRLQPEQMYVRLYQRGYVLAASMILLQIKSWQRGRAGKVHCGEAWTPDNNLTKMRRVLTQRQGSGL